MGVILGGALFVLVLKNDSYNLRDGALTEIMATYKYNHVNRQASLCFSPRIRHRNEFTLRAWEKAVQGLGKAVPPSWHARWVIFISRHFLSTRRFYD